MQRVITDYSVELLVERSAFDVVHCEGAAQSGFMIDIVADASDSLAGHLNEFGTDVDAFDDIAEAGKVFAPPTGTASYIENAAPRPQGQRHRDVLAGTQKPESFGSHSFAW